MGQRFVIWAAVLMAVSLFECQGFKAGEYKVITLYGRRCCLPLVSDDCWRCEAAIACPSHTPPLPTIMGGAACALPRAVLRPGSLAGYSQSPRRMCSR